MCQLQTLTNEPSFYTVKATSKDTKVARLDAKYIHQCMMIYPHVAMRLAMSVIDNLSPYVRYVKISSISGLLELTYKWEGKVQSGGQKDGILSKNPYFEGILVKFW